MSLAAVAGNGANEAAHSQTARESQIKFRQSQCPQVQGSDNQESGKLEKAEIIETIEKNQTKAPLGGMLELCLSYLLFILCLPQKKKKKIERGQLLGRALLKQRTSAFPFPREPMQSCVALPYA